METRNNYQNILFFSFFSLLIFNLDASPSPSPSPLSSYATSSEASPSPSPSPLSSYTTSSEASPSPSSSPSATPNSQPVSSPAPEAAAVPSPSPGPASAAPFSNPEPVQESLTKSIFPIFPSLLEAVPVLSHFTDPIKRICNNTDYPDVCVRSLSPSLLKGKTDLYSVIEVAIKSAAEHTKEAVNAAVKIANDANTPSHMVPLVNDCKGSYDDALDNFESAMNALGNRDVGTMNSMLSAAITDSSDCEDSLSGNSSPLYDFNTKLSQMTSNCLAIVSLIKQ